MADVLHRQTLELRKSVNTPDYDTAVWLVNPNLSEVAGHPVRHWRIMGDSVTLKTQVERDAADLAYAKEERLRAIETAWTEQARRGIAVTDGLTTVTLPSGLDDATELQALLISVADEPDAAVVALTQVDGIPHVTTNAAFRVMAVAYETEFKARRGAIVAAKLAANTATSVAAVDSVEVPNLGQ